MDLEPSPWADASSSSQQPTSTSDSGKAPPSASKPTSSTSGQAGPRSTGPRRMITQATKLQSVDDDPLGPLGLPGGGSDTSSETVPVSASGPPLPQKEQLVVRTTIPQQQQSARRGPADPHYIDDDISQGFSGPRAPPPVAAAVASPVQSNNQPSVSIERAAKPTFHITVGDPHKVGDLTSSHIVYSVRTQTTSKAYRQPEFEVKRRYRDFLWLYTTLHGNNPGIIVPPAPEKQALNRFDTNFVESRRAALEKMLVKIAAHPTLQHDADLKLFLESEAFNVDIKHKERRDPLPAESKGMFGFGIGVGSSNKFVEQDEWFHDRKVYLDALEAQLRALMKAMESMINQRKGMAEAASDFSASLHALSTVELSPTLSGPLEALSELQLTIRDVYERQGMQDMLTFGIILDEYIRLIGSVKQAFGQRQKAFHSWHSAEQDLQKCKASQDKVLRQGKSQQDRINQINAEVAEAERKTHQARLLFEDIGKLMRTELDRFEREKVEDFKSGVETFLEGAVEAQKELIEKWETFLTQLDAEDEEAAFHRSPSQIQASNKPSGDTAIDRARATINDDSD
ncbi:Sorting nexin-2 [Ceratocystis fimbriata CBS 114723]|uniref:Sorting nexin-2 n=1 Tax=Ceratocystis fimbriata CBS 114723 TaxID=1035309 RepID=A0A2C5WXW1_9PEZI|nr:Sorting nexin-2 [Ceratocystis fimbriata CBS 114723]